MLDILNGRLPVILFSFRLSTLKEESDKISEGIDFDKLLEYNSNDKRDFIREIVVGKQP